MGRSPQGRTQLVGDRSRPSQLEQSHIASSSSWSWRWPFCMAVVQADGSVMSDLQADRATLHAASAIMKIDECKLR